MLFLSTKLIYPGIGILMSYYINTNIINAKLRITFDKSNANHYDISAQFKIN